MTDAPGSPPSPSPKGITDGHELTRWRHRHEVRSLIDTLAAYREAASALAARSAELQAEVATLRRRVRHTPRGAHHAVELEFGRDERAPAAARRAVFEAMADAHATAIVTACQRIASELAADAVRRYGASHSQTLVLRVQHSRSAVTVEVETPRFARP